MYTRKLEDYWLVWTEGHEWPELLASESMAKDRAEHLAKDRIGYVVHLCRVESVGTIMIPNNRNVSGQMADAAAIN